MKKVYFFIMVVFVFVLNTIIFYDENETKIIYNFDESLQLNEYYNSNDYNITMLIKLNYEDFVFTPEKLDTSVKMKQKCYFPINIMKKKTKI